MSCGLSGGGGVWLVLAVVDALGEADSGEVGEIGGGVITGGVVLTGGGVVTGGGVIRRGFSHVRVAVCC